MKAPTIITYILIVVVVTAGMAWAVTGKKTSGSDDKAYAETNMKYVDAGEIKVSDEKTEDFKIRSAGTKPLVITGISSSCGCTSGKVIYNGWESKEYSMHGKRETVTEIAPGEEAIIRLTYRPATMPVYGKVQRDVYVYTNDPENLKLKFSITAIVK